MPVDLSVFDKIRTKADYDRANEEFKMRKQLGALQLAQAEKELNKAKQLDLKSAATNAFIKAASGQPLSPEEMAIARTYDAMNAKTYTDPFGNVVKKPGALSQLGVAQPSPTVPQLGSYDLPDLGNAPKAPSTLKTPTSANQVVAAMNSGAMPEPIDSNELPELNFSTGDAAFDNSPAGRKAIAEAKLKASLEKQKQDIKEAKGLPEAIAGAEQTFDIIQGIKNDPNLSAAVGVRNPLKGAVPFTPWALRGSPVTDFNAKVSQLQGKQFLEAYAQLKGGGAISEVEGKKAESAIARMDTAQSEKAFKGALDEFSDVVNNAYMRMQKKAGQKPQSLFEKGKDQFNDNKQPSVVNWEDLP